MLTPATDPKTGAVVLHDIWVHGEWIGSRSTIAQCVEALRHRGWPSSVMATGKYRIEHGSPAKIIFED